MSLFAFSVFTLKEDTVLPIAVLIDEAGEGWGSELISINGIQPTGIASKVGKSPILLRGNYPC